MVEVIAASVLAIDYPTVHLAQREMANPPILVFAVPTLELNTLRGNRITYDRLPGFTVHFSMCPGAAGLDKNVSTFTLRSSR